MASRAGQSRRDRGEDHPSTPAEQAGSQKAERRAPGKIRLDGLRSVPTIPETLVRRHRVFPFELQDGVLKIAMDDPSDVRALDDFRQVTGCRVIPHLASREDIDRAIWRWYRAAHMQDAIRIEEFDVSEEDEVSDPDAPVVRLVDGIIDQSISEGVSDLHIVPERTRTAVRFRVDGVLRDVLEFSRRLHPAVVTRLKVMSGMDIAERRLPQDGQIQIRRTHDVDLRVSMLPTTTGEQVVIRVLDQSRVVPDLESLGHSPGDLARIRQATASPYGLILLTGPTGSGKTTTLYAALKEIISREINVVTVEDPPEYNMEEVAQVGVRPKAGLTFASALRAILRQDPDVIMIGEIRDAETASIAVQAAMTGHLVFSTLHTNDASSAPVRLLDMGVEPYLVASSLLCVVAQRLLRKVCDECAEEYELPPNAPERFLLGVDSDAVHLSHGRGCGACGGSGYRGRTAVAETMLVTRKLRNLIRMGASSDEIRDEAVTEGMALLRQVSVDRVLRGETTMKEAMKAVFSGISEI